MLGAEEQDAIDEAKAKIIRAIEEQADLEKQQHAAEQEHNQSSSQYNQTDSHSSQRTLTESEDDRGRPDSRSSEAKQRRPSTFSNGTALSGIMGGTSTSARSRRLSSGPHKDDSNSKREQNVQGDLDHDLEAALAKDTEQKSKPGQGMIWQEEEEDTAL